VLLQTLPDFEPVSFLRAWRAAPGLEAAGTGPRSATSAPNLASADWRSFSPVEPLDEIVLLQRGRRLMHGVEGQPRPPGDVEE
jgi:hypothetical protein